MRLICCNLYLAAVGNEKSFKKWVRAKKGSIFTVMEEPVY